MVYRTNAATGFASGVTVAQPIAQGLSSVLNAQGGLFHLVLSGVSNGKAVSEVTLIDSVQRALNPYEQFSDYIKLAESLDLRLMVSNTTEAGIAYVDDDSPDMQPQKSFPGKVTAFLYRRYQHFTGTEDKGLIIF
jgi:tagaturonate reductase